MSTTVNLRLTTKPGLELSPISDRLRIAASEGQFGNLPALDISAKEGKQIAAGWGGRDAYVAARFIETKEAGNPGTIAYASGVNGLRFQTANPAVNNDDHGITTNETRLVAPGKVFKAMCRVSVSSAANLGIALGFGGGWAAAAQPELYTAPNDGVYLISPAGSANMVGRVVQNGAAAVDTGTLLVLADSVEVVIGVEFRCGIEATAVSGITAANCYGNWWVNGIRTSFTAAQLTALASLIVTTAPTLQGHLGFRVNGVTQRNSVVSWATLDADR